jgi:hypothetical protein
MMTTRYTETELKIMTAALPAVEAVPASQDSCWPGDGPAHDDDCTVSDHAASIAAVAATEGLSWEFSTWSAAAKHWRALTREASETRANPELRMKVYAYVTADHCAVQRAVRPGVEVDGTPISRHGDYQAWTSGKRDTLRLGTAGLTSVSRHARLVQCLFGW